jgi:hypothetical protein
MKILLTARNIKRANKIKGFLNFVQIIATRIIHIAHLIVDKFCPDVAIFPSPNGIFQAFPEVRYKNPLLREVLNHE